MKRELQVGDRVRVYDHSMIYTGTVQPEPKLNFPGGVLVECDDYAPDGNIQRMQVHRRQCVRLVPKKPRPPQGERVEGERVERYLWEYVTGDCDAFCFLDKEHAESTWQAKSLESSLTNELKRTVHLVELKPGEVILDPNKVFLEITGKLAFAHSSLGAEVVRRALEGGAP